MDTVEEEKLRKEIQYLTRLIEAHKAIKEFQAKGKHSKTTSSKGAEAGACKWRNSLPCRGVSIPSWTNSGSISSYQLSKSKHLAGQEREASPQHWHANQRFEALAQVTEEASVCVSRNNVSRRTVVMCGSHESQTHSQQTSSWNLESPRIGSSSYSGRREERCHTTPLGRRKRSTSSSSGREFRRKRKKYSLSSAACLSQSKYVWQAHASKLTRGFGRSFPPKHSSIPPPSKEPVRLHYGAASSVSWLSDHKMMHRLY